MINLYLLRLMDFRTMFVGKLIMLAVAITAFLLFPAGGETVTETVTQPVAPYDPVPLITAIFAGVGTVGTLIVSILLPVIAGRQRRVEALHVEAAAAIGLEVAKAQTSLEQTKLEIMRAQVELSKVKDNVVLIERNTNSMTSTIKELALKAGVSEGVALEKAQGAATAAVLAEGQRQGMEQERSAASAAGPGAPYHADSDATLQAVTAAAAAAAAIAAPAAAALAAPPAAAIAAPPAADIAAPPVVQKVVPPAEQRHAQFQRQAA